MILAWIALATFFGGAASAALASVFLLLAEVRRSALLPHLISFATGAMLAAALLDLLPEAVASVGMQHLHAVGATVLGGIGLFFVLEKLILWRHCHAQGCQSHAPSEAQRDRAAGWIVLFGDGVHNVFDGVLIAAAFLTDAKLGVVTTLAITAHEIPQELGDLAVLLHAGMSARRALWFNAATSMGSILGGLAGYFALRRTLTLLPYAICVAAASLIYVAVADLIPGLHRRQGPGAGLAQVPLMGCGVALIALAELWLGG